MVSHPLRWAAGSVVLALLVLLLWVVPERGGAPGLATPDATSGEARPAPGVAAAAVLHRWDQRRARAFARAAPADLRALYLPGSRTGAADVRQLAAYAARGLRVHGLRMQVLALEVLQQEGPRLRLRVTDRVARAVAVGPTGRALLPRDQASTRVVDLRRHAGQWRVAEVTS